MEIDINDLDSYFTKINYTLYTTFEDLFPEEIHQYFYRLEDSDKKTAEHLSFYAIYSFGGDISYDFNNINLGINKYSEYPLLLKDIYINEDELCFLFEELKERKIAEFGYFKNLYDPYTLAYKLDENIDTKDYKLKIILIDN